MSYGQAQLSALLNDASVTALITQGTNGIFYDTVVPSKYPVVGGDVGATDSTINYYRVAPVNGGIAYMQTTFSVNCRAATMATAESIARAVLDVVNRHYSESIYFVCSVLSVLPPADPTDVYNSPVEVRAVGRTI
jgi:hypothetical protein